MKQRQSCFWHNPSFKNTRNDRSAIKIVDSKFRHQYIPLAYVNMLITSNMSIINVSYMHACITHDR